MYHNILYTRSVSVLGNSKREGASSMIGKTPAPLEHTHEVVSAAQCHYYSVHILPYWQQQTTGRGFQEGVNFETAQRVDETFFLFFFRAVSVSTKIQTAPQINHVTYDMIRTCVQILHASHRPALLLSRLRLGPRILDNGVIQRWQ